jgi:hypothetical protein
MYNAMEISNDKYSAADICFVCDTTGSMDRYIEPVRLILISFLNNIAELINTKPRVAFIGYKDKLKDDELNKVTSTPIEVKDFTKIWYSLLRELTVKVG